MRRQKLLLVLLTPVILYLGFRAWLSFPVTPLPDASQVKKMTAELRRSPGKEAVVSEFVVPAEHVASVLAALSPTTRSVFPPSWWMWGDLKLTCEDGQVIEVHLFWTGQQVGAFAVGPWGQQV